METTSPFSIKACSRTLKDHLIDNKSTGCYVVPVFQRPYSWDEKQLEKLLSDILTSFWGYDGEEESEPLFIGTMQLSEPNQANEQDVIDGQQRITSLLLLLKVLQTNYPEHNIFKQIRFDSLKTKVNNGFQQHLFEKAINATNFDQEDINNKYLNNAHVISKYIRKKTENSNFNIDLFINHLLNNVYIVVVETKAGLTKTLQIFNSINTTGLDLNGSDLFKIRFYEYLRDKKNEDESVFDQINDLYKKIDEKNVYAGGGKTSMLEILKMYQYILIAENEMPTTLYQLNTETFYERLFETMFHIEEWGGFKNNIHRIDLCLKKLDKIINLRFEWKDKLYLTLDNAFDMKVIWNSRYSRYWSISVIFLYYYQDEINKWEKLRAFNKYLSKLFFIYSVIYLRTVNRMHQFVYNLIKLMGSNSIDQLIVKIKEEIRIHEDGFIGIISHDITAVPSRKNNICRLSAFLEQSNRNDLVDSMEDMWSEIIFDDEIDIEHIQSYHNKDESQRAHIWEEWGEMINSIGNLIILERDVNRSISNSIYEEKKIAYIQRSKYEIVNKLANEYDEWNLDNCKKRMEYEIEKLRKYLFDNKEVSPTS